MRQSSVAPTMAMIEPTERSMPFVPMTMAMPSATMRDRHGAIDDVDEVAEQPALDDADAKKCGERMPSTARISASASGGQIRRGEIALLRRGDGERRGRREGVHGAGYRLR